MESKRAYYVERTLVYKLLVLIDEYGMDWPMYIDGGTLPRIGTLTTRELNILSDATRLIHGEGVW